MTSAVHDRMPVILETSAYDLWLDPGMKDAVAVSGLLKPFDPHAMRCYAVSSRVDNVQNDDEEFAKQVELIPAQTGLF